MLTVSCRGLCGYRYRKHTLDHARSETRQTTTLPLPDLYRSLDDQPNVGVVLHEPSYFFEESCLMRINNRFVTRLSLLLTGWSLLPPSQSLLHSVQ